jgi:hypothetical protein
MTVKTDDWIISLVKWIPAVHTIAGNRLIFLKVNTSRQIALNLKAMIQG